MSIEIKYLVVQDKSYKFTFLKTYFLSFNITLNANLNAVKKLTLNPLIKITAWIRHDFGTRI